MTNLYDLDRDELRLLLSRSGCSPFHADRIWGYLYRDLVDSIAAMAEVPPRVRMALAKVAQLGIPPVAAETDSKDGFTRKYLLGLVDGERIETVRMHFDGRVTACVSSQVGCAMGCVFCATGQMGYTRNLTAGEIVTQAVHVARELRAPNCRAGVLHPPSGPKAAGASHQPYSNRLRNVVLMGMGEPLLNYDAVMKASAILRDSAGLAVAGDRITVSTVGVVPGILRLAKEKQSVHLAVSLHAATQAGRAALVPVAKKWPLDELMSACRTYSESTGRRIFYEWTLIAGKNDRPDEARAVGRLLKGLPAQVNLIPLNPTAGYHEEPTGREAAREFQRVLKEEFGFPSTIRQRRGIDVAAGCGQLATAN